MLGLVIWKNFMAVASVEKDYESAVERARSLELLDKGAWEYFAVRLYSKEARAVASVKADHEDSTVAELGLVIGGMSMTVFAVEKDYVSAVERAAEIGLLEPYAGKWFAVKLYGYEASVIAHVQENIDIQAGIAANLAAAEMED
jgi:hypothetical protein